MPYFSTVTSPLTKESVTIVSNTFQTHRERLLDVHDTYVSVWKEARNDLLTNYWLLMPALTFCGLISTYAVIVFTVITSVLLVCIPKHRNRFIYAQQAYTFLMAWKYEINRSITTPDAQILTPEK